MTKRRVGLILGGIGCLVGTIIWFVGDTSEEPQHAVVERDWGLADGTQGAKSPITYNLTDRIEAHAPPGSLGRPATLHDFAETLRSRNLLSDGLVPDPKPPLPPGVTAKQMEKFRLRDKGLDPNTRDLYLRKRYMRQRRREFKRIKKASEGRLEKPRARDPMTGMRIYPEWNDREARQARHLLENKPSGEAPPSYDAEFLEKKPRERQTAEKQVDTAPESQGTEAEQGSE